MVKESILPKDWFKKGEIDLESAKILLAAGTLETAAFHIQQAIEKYLKGYLLGKGWKLVSAISAIAGLTGAILAYIVIGGQFLTDLFEPIFGGNQIIFTFIYFTSGILLIYLGTKSVSRTELIMIVLFFAIIILIFLRVLPQINYSFFSGFDLKYFFLPYGVILFSLWGASIIPEIKEILGKEN